MYQGKPLIHQYQSEPKSARVHQPSLISNKRAHAKICRELILEEDNYRPDDQENKEMDAQAEANRKRKMKELFEHKDILVFPLRSSCHRDSSEPNRPLSIRRSMRLVDKITTLTPRENCNNGANQSSFRTLSGMTRVVLKSRSGSNSAANRYENSKGKDVYGNSDEDSDETLKADSCYLD